MLARFDALHRVVHEARGTGNVLIHCAGGRSRSATITIAYVMKQYGKTYAEAFAQVKARRSFVWPNPQITQDLRAYELQLAAERVSK